MPRKQESTKSKERKRKDKQRETEQLIKSKERVKKFAEVNTPAKVVSMMLDLLESVNNEDGIDPFEPHWTFLEPACGDGNFLVQILQRKLDHCETPEQGVTAMDSIFGIEIQLDNVQAAKKRMWDIWQAKFGNACQMEILTILNSHIVWGDFLKKAMMNGSGRIWFLPNDEEEDGQQSLF